MSFEEILHTSIQSKNFNLALYRKNFKERPHISKSKIELTDNTKYLKTNEFTTVSYVNELVQRYVSSLQLSYDLIFSIYEVNTSSLLCFRVYQPKENIEIELTKFMKGFKRPNLETRIIGMQNGQKLDPLKHISNLITKYRLPVVEVDLFGQEIRYVAIDSKLGISFNILVNDILYKPGELINNTTKEQFERNLGK